MTSTWGFRQITKDDGEVQTGFFLDDRLHGFVQRKSMNKASNDQNDLIFIQGTYTLGILNGLAEKVWRDGDRYIGNYKNGLQNGQGAYLWKDGEIYFGEYVNNKREGEGSFRWSDNAFYHGRWKNDVMKGQGVQILSNKNAL